MVASGSFYGAGTAPDKDEGGRARAGVLWEKGSRVEAGWASSGSFDCGAHDKTMSASAQDENYIINNYK